MMVGTPKGESQIFSFLRSKTVKGRTIIIGLKSDNSSREMLLRVLTSVVTQGDNVLAVHVQESNSTFDPNTFHIHEDLCKSKQVDFQVKVCVGNSYVSELTHQVRVNFATILAIGCSSPWPKDSVVANCLKELPPLCSLFVMDNGGRILIQRQGTSQQGSTRVAFQSSLSYSSKDPNFDQSGTSRQLKNSSTMPLPSTPSSSSVSSSMQPADKRDLHNVKRTMQLPDFSPQKPCQRLAILEANESCRKFTLQEINSATNCFDPAMIIAEGGNSRVYSSKLENGQAAAIKVLKKTHWSGEDFLQEVELLSNIKHENIVQIIGFCYSEEMNAVVYDLLKDSLNRKLRDLRWSERMGVAIGVAKALEFLHHSCKPPGIHRDVKSSNILLSDNFQPQLSDFGAAMVHHKPQQDSTNTKPLRVIGTFGYLAPEYIMYGKIDEKIDVYSYGVVLLELITGKQAIQMNESSNRESLVLWARSLLSSGLSEDLIDPYLNEDYNKDEMQTMIIAARVCLLHSSSRRPTMQMILRLLEDPAYWLKKQKEREEFLEGINSNGETGLWRHGDAVLTSDLLVMDELIVILCQLFQSQTLGSNYRLLTYW